MLGDYTTTTLKGAMFRNVRYQIMGVIPDVYLVPEKVKV